MCMYEGKDNDVCAYHEGMVLLFLKLAVWYGREGEGCSQLHAPTVVSLGKKYPTPIEQEAGCFPAGNQTVVPRVSTPSA